MALAAPSIRRITLRTLYRSQGANYEGASHDPGGVATNKKRRNFSSNNLRSTASARKTAPVHRQRFLLDERPSSSSREVFELLRRANPRRYYADQIVKVPEMAESISEGTLKQWQKSVGDYVNQDDEVATIETDKIDVAVNAPASGKITALFAKEEDTVTIGQDLMSLELGDDVAPSKKAASESGTSSPKGSASPDQSTSSEPSSSDSRSPESKSPAESSVEVSPKPKDGSKHEPSAPPEPPARQQANDSNSKEAQPPTRPRDESGSSRNERRVKMNRMRLRIAERLKQSQTTAAALTTFNEVDMSAIMQLRKAFKSELLESKGVKLGFMGAFSRACVLAMKDYPTINASIEGPSAGDTIVYHDYIDMSIAVATEKGLVTPVVRNIENMDIIEIETAIAGLGQKARANKLSIEDMVGGTFTISNGGVFGSLLGTPIINLPQTAVMGLHAIKEKPVAIDGKIEIRPMMYLALTYDHRLLDGREAVSFLVKVKKYIENPQRMLLGI